MSTVRLAIVMQRKGWGNLSECGRLVKEGMVIVNGELLLNAGRRRQVLTTDTIELDDRAICATVILNKPANIESIPKRHDPKGTTFQFFVPENNARYKQLGRVRIPHPDFVLHRRLYRDLDFQDTGLLLFTKKKDVFHKLSSRRSKVEKEYIVRLRRTNHRPPLTSETGEAQEKIDIIQKGFLKNEKAGISYDSDESGLRVHRLDVVDDDTLRFVLLWDQRDHVRRILQRVNWEVETLHRSRIGNCTVDNLQPGQWRYLHPIEQAAILNQVPDENEFQFDW
jgi:pseudouridine synthase